LSILPVLLGWPMLLMPVHILFLQLIIDPACSVVFEAEPLEPEAMKAPPRRPDQRLFDSEVMMRGLWQGLGLLTLLLATFAGARLIAPSDAVRDDTARGLTFVVLVLANLALIHTNRSWGRTVWWGRALAGGQFAWIALGTLAVLSVVLIVPAVGRLFSFVTPSPFLLCAALGMVALSLLWFEAVKWGIRARNRHVG
jgi:Ca2+-transporting ATPase